MLDTYSNKEFDYMFNTRNSSNEDEEEEEAEIEPEEDVDDVEEDDYSEGKDEY
jgi:outer membrane protein assembly factor BamE (lipoprotein component of BamABCDE complex)